MLAPWVQGVRRIRLTNYKVKIEGEEQKKGRLRAPSLRFWKPPLKVVAHLIPPPPWQGLYIIGIYKLVRAARVMGYERGIS